MRVKVKLVPHGTFRRTRRQRDTRPLRHQSATGPYCCKWRSRLSIANTALTWTALSHPASHGSARIHGCKVPGCSRVQRTDFSLHKPDQNIPLHQDRLGSACDTARYAGRDCSQLSHAPRSQHSSSRSLLVPCTQQPWMRLCLALSITGLAMSFAALCWTHRGSL